MKQFKFLALMLAMIASVSFFSSCSSDEDDSPKVITNDPTLSGQWNYSGYSSVDGYHQKKEFEDKTNYNLLNQLLRECPSIPYTKQGEKTETTDFDYDLCELSGHQPHESISMTFNGSTCKFVETSAKLVEHMKKTEKSCKYVFQEGTYIGSHDGYSYCGYVVSQYSVGYQTVGGYVAMMAFDGNYGYDAYEKKYSYEYETQTTEVSNLSLSYEVVGDEITFSGGDVKMTGKISEDKTSIRISQTAPVQRYFTINR